NDVLRLRRARDQRAVDGIDDASDALANLRRTGAGDNDLLQLACRDGHHEVVRDRARRERDGYVLRRVADTPRVEGYALSRDAGRRNGERVFTILSAR